MISAIESTVASPRVTHHFFVSPDLSVSASSGSPVGRPSVRVDGMGARSLIGKHHAWSTPSGPGVDEATVESHVYASAPSLNLKLSAMIYPCL
jgi:hypothetical protein